MKKIEKMKKESNLWIKITFLPLIVGFSLVYAANMPLFRVIGWVLLIFGCITTGFYLYMKYKEHKKKIDDFKKKLLGKEEEKE